MNLPTAAFGAGDGVSLTLGVLELALGLLVIRQLGRFSKAVPWLVALVAFFLVRGGDRVYVAVAGGDRLSINVLLDAILLLTLVLLLIGMQRLMRAFKLVEEEARHWQQEYGRALVDYRRLARHRIANPLAAIRGAIETLEARPQLDEAQRSQLLGLAREAVERLEHTSLDPSQQNPEEHELDPRPHGAAP